MTNGNYSMTALITIVPRTLTQGSVFAAQRLPANSKPGKVEINRSIYLRAQGADGKCYGRTEIQRLLRVESCTEKLNVDEEAALRAHGVNDSELTYINKRLIELSTPAYAHAVAAEMYNAEMHIQAAVEIGANTVGALRFVLERLNDAQLVLDDGGTSRKRQAARPTLDASPAEERLLRALQAANKASTDAAEAFKQLDSGQNAHDELILELQRTWFSTHDMFKLLEERECFFRPRGWSKLRTQVLAGRICRKRKGKVKRLIRSSHPGQLDT